MTDARRGKMFTQIIKEITVAAKLGGGNPDGNPRLRFAIDKAKESNMPADNIKRAVMKGTGELPGTVYEDVLYEAYGAGGVAMLVEAVTDNKTRTVSEIRHILERHHGKMASSGAVSFQFHKKGIITVPSSAISEDDLMSIVLDAGADDLKAEHEVFTIVTAPENFEAVKKSLDSKGIKVESAELQMVAENTVKVEGKDAENVIRLMEALEEHDDVQKVHANFDIDDKVLAALAAQ